MWELPKTMIMAVELVELDDISIPSIVPISMMKREMEVEEEEEKRKSGGRTEWAHSF